MIAPKLHRIYRRIRLLIRPEAKRYENLFKIIEEYKCKRIMEIGTYRGDHAEEMIRFASLIFPSEEIEYYGFDLFEEAKNAVICEEFSKGKPPHLSSVKSRLDKTGAKIFLRKGNTREVLPKAAKKLPIMDLIFIDGGHSLETIESDWKNIQEIMGENTVVVFDDYYNIDKVGCKRIVESLDRQKFRVEILAPKDKFRKEWGTLEIQFVKVTRR